MAEDKPSKFRVFRRSGEFPTRVPADRPLPLLKDSDPEAKQLQLVADGHAKMFKMSDAEQAQAYEAVCDKIAKGEAVLGHEEVTWSETQQSYMIYARWNEMFQEPPTINEESHEFRDRTT